MAGLDEAQTLSKKARKHMAQAPHGDSLADTWVYQLADALGLRVMKQPSWLPLPFIGVVSDLDTAGEVHLDGWIEAGGRHDPIRLAATDAGHVADAVALHIECGRELAGNLLRFLVSELQDS
jgi:hypothetical protein